MKASIIPRKDTDVTTEPKNHINVNKPPSNATGIGSANKINKHIFNILCFIILLPSVLLRTFKHFY